MRWPKEKLMNQGHTRPEHLPSLLAIYVPPTDSASEVGRWGGGQAGLRHAVSPAGETVSPLTRSTVMWYQQGQWLRRGLQGK